MTSRRDLLKAALGFGSAIVITHTKPSGLLAGEPASKQDCLKAGAGQATPGASVHDLANASLEPELEQLLRYHTKLQAARDAFNAEHPLAFTGPTQGITVPFATVPVNLYVRLTKRMLEIPEPQIPLLLAAMRHNYGARLDDTMSLLAQRLQLVPTEVQLTPTFTLKLPNGDPALLDRVITPKYIIDMDEPHFGMRTIANMLLDSVIGLWTEWAFKLEVAAQAASEAAGSSPVYTTAQVRPVQCWAKTEAYMLEFMAYSVGCGFSHPQAEVNPC